MKKAMNMILAGAMMMMLAASIVPARARKANAATRAAATVAVKITNFQFTPKTVTVAVGGTVEWTDEAGRHTVEADDGSFKSETLAAGGKFSHTFAKAGKYPYHCMFHGEKGGKDMAGTVIVK